MEQGKWWGRAGAALACAALGACGVFGSRQMLAETTLVPVAGSTVSGSVGLSERPEGVQVNYNISGLTPETEHSFVIHAGGSCGGPGARSAGPRFGTADLPPSASSSVAAASPRGVRRAAPVTRIWADANGVAMGFFMLPGVSLDGLRSVVGRTMIVHAGADDGNDSLFAAQGVKGNAEGEGAGADKAGPALACGVIAR